MSTDLFYRYQRIAAWRDQAVAQALGEEDMPIARVSHPVPVGAWVIEPEWPFWVKIPTYADRPEGVRDACIHAAVERLMLQCPVASELIA